MTDVQAFLVVAVIAAVNLMLRFLPSLIYAGRKTPPLIEYLGRVLPYAVRGMLVIYCLRGVNFITVSGFAPELLSVAVIVTLYLWRRNTVLCIFLGTAVYMLLKSFIFQ